MAVSAHWCGGKLTDIDFLVEHADCPCGKKKGAMKPGCCKDKIATLKANDDLNAAKTLVFKASIIKGSPVSYWTIEVVTVSAVDRVTLSLYRPPPDNPKLPSYLRHGAFLI